jgi:hypothetical protein
MDWQKNHCELYNADTHTHTHPMNHNVNTFVQWKKEHDSQMTMGAHNACKFHSLESIILLNKKQCKKLKIMHLVLHTLQTCESWWSIANTSPQILPIMSFILQCKSTDTTSPPKVTPTWMNPIL